MILYSVLSESGGGAKETSEGIDDTRIAPVLCSNYYATACPVAKAHSGEIGQNGERNPRDSARRERWA
jgi:hypothetical protein